MNRVTCEIFITTFISELIDLGVISRENLVGCSDSEIDIIMESQGVQKIPLLYRYFLSMMGKEASGFMTGEFVLYDLLIDLKIEAIDMLELYDATFRPASTNFVFWVHPWHMFMFFDTEIDSEDPPIYFWEEGMLEPELSYPSFSELLSVWLKYYKRVRPTWERKP